MGVDIRAPYRAGPILRVVDRFDPNYPVSYLTRYRVLCRIVHIRRREATVGRRQRVQVQVVMRFLQCHGILFTFSARK